MSLFQYFFVSLFMPTNAAYSFKSKRGKNKTKKLTNILFFLYKLKRRKKNYEHKKKKTLHYIFITDVGMTIFDIVSDFQ